MEPSHEYDDIIDLPHHVSAERPHMPMTDRAAQFSPFAALTGYDAAIVETARLTDEKRELRELRPGHFVLATEKEFAGYEEKISTMEREGR